MPLDPILHRPTGGLGIPGLYVPSDPGAPDSDAALGMMKFPFGKFFEKGLSLGCGQCNVKQYNRCVARSLSLLFCVPVDGLG